MIDIKQMIEKRIMNDEIEQQRKTELPEIWHPSILGYCERQMFLSKIHARMFDKIIKGSMMSGTILHHWVQHFPELQETCDIEKPIKLQINGSLAFIQGSADIVLKDNSYVWDIKSAKSLAFIPMKQHIDQLNVYLAGLNAPEGELLYIEKNTLETVPYKIKFNQQLFDETVGKVLSVYEALKVWENAGSFNNPIPFTSCGCYFCKNEVINPEIKKLMK